MKNIFTLILFGVSAFIAGRLLAPWCFESARIITDSPKALNEQIEKNDETYSSSTNEKLIITPELASMPSIDLEAIYAKAETGNAIEAADLRSDLAEWAKTDPIAALEFASSEISPMAESDLAILAILNEWMKSNPNAVWEWTTKNAIHQSEYIINGIAKTNPNEAWNMAKEFVEDYPERRFTIFMNALSGVTYSGNFADAINMITQTEVPVDWETPDRQYTFIVPIVEEWASYSPEAVKDWIDASPAEANSPEKALALAALIHSWTASDPLAALNYSDSLEIENAKQAGTAMALANYIENDIEGAIEWLSSRDYHQDYDWGVFNIATNPELIANDTSAAISLAAAIQAPEIREGSLTHIYKELLIRDPEIASQYFDSNPLLTEYGRKQAMLSAEMQLTDVENSSSQDTP